MVSTDRSGLSDHGNLSAHSPLIFRRRYSSCRNFLRGWAQMSWRLWLCIASMARFCWQGVCFVILCQHWWVQLSLLEQSTGQCHSQLCVRSISREVNLLGIGVIGADMSNVVANMFATSNVSKEFQSISVAIVVTMLSLSQTIAQSITSALITSNPPNVVSF